MSRQAMSSQTMPSQTMSYRNVLRRRPARRNLTSGRLTSGVALLGALWGLAACSPGSEVDGRVIVGLDPDQSSGGTSSSGGAPTVPVMPEENEIYEAPPPPGCGDSERSDDEACDDGNRNDGDGCSGNCLVVENGYTCDSAGSPCELVELCGDSRVVLNERCDDGNAVGGDGCSATCQLEVGYSCPNPGAACISSVVCGDGFVALGEGCDDGNLVAGDGCSATCQLEAGYECLVAGAKCRTVCGDGLLTGKERCDDGNTDAGDGCAPTCTLEVGFACDAPGVPCRATRCQDGVVEGTEQCDDQNAVPFDGCTEACVNEPRCRYDADGVYTCAAVCGDGMKFPEEECDDGNTQPDDGCNERCLREPGYFCENAAAEIGDVLVLPIIYRDFENDHPQFEIDPLDSPRLPGIVLSQIGDNGKPAYDPSFSFQGKPWTMDGPTPNGAGQKVASGAGTLDAAEIAERFSEWYTDVPGVNQTLVDTLDLQEIAPDTFQFAATGDTEFFPIDTLGFGNQGNDAAGVAHNFHFTSETRQWFEFQGGEQLLFSGDDDVWVFVNGQLTVDLGGIHGELQGSIELSNDGAASTLCLQDTVGAASVCSAIDVPVNPLGVNEIVVFQAERHVVESNYTLTLKGFNAPVTRCQSVCGDGVVTPDESCDDGELNGTGYGVCNADCTPGPRCGDGIVNGEEACDNGANRDAYQLDETSCGPGCTAPSHCGDGVVDPSFGEQCDDGVNDGSYGGCSSECLLGPRCGDGEVNGDEECDDGNRRNGDSCDLRCRIERVPA